MINFLKQTRKFLNAKEPICLVLGNESCDLDSAVSAICLAYFFQNIKSQQCSNSSNYLPILNIPKLDYPLKTEVKFAFEEKNISQDLLTFKDELNEDFLQNNRFILVDHHVSPYLKRCFAIYDHRPKDANVIIPENCAQHLHLVGSCATLVAEEYINSKLLSENETTPLDLLRSTIVLDTVNFSKSAARATSKDVEVCSTLEDILSKFNVLQTRENVFETLVKARADTSSLTADQLLRKDYKILTSLKNENIKIAIPGFPLTVQEFVLKSNAEEAIKKFANEFNCKVVLLMGMFVDPEDNTVHRDFGIINNGDTSLCESIRQGVLSLKNPESLCEQYKDCKFMNGSFYKQLNIKITRKHVIPIVKNIIDE